MQRRFKAFKAYCEKFEFDKKTFNSNKQIVLNSIENLKSEFTVLQNEKLSIEKRKTELSYSSELYNFNLIELSLGKLHCLDYCSWNFY